MGWESVEKNLPVPIATLTVSNYLTRSCMETRNFTQRDHPLVTHKNDGNSFSLILHGLPFRRMYCFQCTRCPSDVNHHVCKVLIQRFMSVLYYELQLCEGASHSSARALEKVEQHLCEIIQAHNILGFTSSVQASFPSQNYQEVFSKRFLKKLNNAFKESYSKASFRQSHPRCVFGTSLNFTPADVRGQSPGARRPFGFLPRYVSSPW